MRSQDLLDEMGCKLREYDWPDYWYIGSERRMLVPGEKVRPDIGLSGPQPDAAPCQIPWPQPDAALDVVCRSSCP